MYNCEYEITTSDVVNMDILSMYCKYGVVVTYNRVVSLYK